MAEVTGQEEAHRHNCPVFGPNTYTPRALLADKNEHYVIYWHRKCVMCNFTSGQKEPGKGITLNNDGTYTVDKTKVEYLE